MLRSRMNCVVAALAALALAMPIAARSPEKSKATARASMDLVNPAALGGTQLKPGTYQVEATESAVKLMQRGKVIAEAPIAWKHEQSKSRYSAIVTEAGAVTEVHFSGKARYARLSSGSMQNGGQGQD
jgi:hypothetical protein